MAENAQPIIIKKIKKGGHGGHHGGSWKVAYADFVTAMMAFFLLLWLLNVSEPEQIKGISGYFQNPSPISAAGGASTSMISLGKNTDVSKGDGQQSRESNEQDNFTPEYTKAFLDFERQQLEALKEELEYAIDTIPALTAFKDQLFLEITDEGLRIQIVDKDKRPMFDLGSAVMKSYAKKILQEIAPLLDRVPNKISLSGHTDSTRYISQRGYSNWELSADRANASRRVLVGAGISSDKISRVVGLASKVPFDAEKPFAPINRRIAIIVLNKRTEDAIMKIEGVDQNDIINPRVVKKKQLGEEIKSGTVRRSGAVIRFDGQ